MTRIYLASRSPRRRELLAQLGVEFEIVDVEIDESWNGSEPARCYVRRLALEKARAGRVSIKEPLPVLAADTEVELDGEILGKPSDQADAIRMLRSLSGRTHSVYSAIALNTGESEQSAVTLSRVSFKPLSLSECEDYVAGGEPMDKAGAYAIQGRAAAFITRLEGSYSGVMGLPLFETAMLLGSAITGNSGKAQT